MLDTKNPLAPITVGSGFIVTVNPANVLNNGTPVNIPSTIVSLTPSATNFIHITSAGSLTVNTSGFPANCLPIAQVTCSSTSVTGIVDSRPDFYLASSGGVVGSLTPAGTSVTGSVFRTSIKSFSATGNSDIYTCPTGKRAIITEITVFNGHASLSATLVAMLKIGGIYYPATPSASITAQLTGSRSVTYILEAGETIAVNMTQQPFNVVVTIMEFDNTSNLKSAKLVTPALTSGDNTIYACPAGKSALVLNNTLTMCSATIGTFSYGNNSGGNITAKFNVVPNGGSPSASTQMSTSTSVSTGLGFAPTATSFTMGPGDFISVNLSAGGADQIAFVTVVEI